MIDTSNPQQIAPPDLTRPVVAWNVVAQTAHAIALEARRNRRVRELADNGRWLVHGLAAVGVDLTPPAVEPARSTIDLSDRELEILRGISDGKSNADIGRQLYVTEHTVKTHARRIFRKLGARDRAHSVAIAYQRGLLR